METSVEEMLHSFVTGQAVNKKRCITVNAFLFASYVDGSFMFGYDEQPE